MKISAIEVGTNSTKFAIAESGEGNLFTIVKKTSNINRLSKDMYKGNCISSEAIEKGIKIIGEYIEQSRNDEVKLISVFSTSVLRDAENKEEFIQKVKDLYGVDIEIIDGENEAYYSFTACRSLMTEIGGPFGVIDIGGGSTEIIIGNKNNIIEKVSLDIGAVRLSELFLTSDPIGQNDILNISNEIGNKFRHFKRKSSGKLRLIGTGGTVKSIGTLISNIDYKEENAIHGISVSKEEIEEVYGILSGLTINERKKIKGLNPKRADVIVPGILILLSAMENLGALEITISSLGVIEGFLADYFLRNL